MQDQRRGQEFKTCYKRGGGAHHGTREAIDNAGENETRQEDLCFFSDENNLSNQGSDLMIDSDCTKIMETWVLFLDD